jgi:hypothetical protein
MESVTLNLRANAAQLLCESNCPPCIVTAACVCLALTRIDSVDSLSPEAAQIVAFLNSVTHFIKTALLMTPVCSSDNDATTPSSQAMNLWFVEFVLLMNHIVSLINTSGTKTSSLLLNFIKRGGMACISEFVSVLCLLLQDHRADEAVAAQIQDLLSICCQCYTLALSVASLSSNSAFSPTLRLISDVWPHACNSASNVQRPALVLIALAVSQLDPEILRDVEASETNLAAIVQVIVCHIESSRAQIVLDDVDYRANGIESACQVLSACLSLQPSSSVAIIPRNIVPHLCSCGWKWARSAVASSIIESFSSLVMLPLRQFVTEFAVHVCGDALRLENASPWLSLVVRLLETNASYMSDIFTDDIATAAADKDSNPSEYATRLLHYATICSLCGKSQDSDAVETVFGFGMGVLFDEVWKSLPQSCDKLIAQRNYLHAFFMSRNVMSHAAISAAAFSDLLLGALMPTDGGCFASLSLTMLLCPCEDYTIENGDFRLEHVKLPDDFAENLMKSLESSPPSESISRALQVSILFRVGMALNWKAPSESEWRHRVTSYYAIALTSSCTMQHVLLQTISEIVLSRAEALPASLSNSLVFRTHQLRNDVHTPFGRNILLQIGLQLKAGHVTLSSIRILLTNVLIAMDVESHLNLLMTRTLVLALAAAGAVPPAILAAEVPDALSIGCSAGRHVLRSLAAADVQGIFDVEIFESVQLLCRLGVSDTLIPEGLFALLLRSFDTGIDVVALKCIAMSLWHAFAPEYAGDAWFRCRLIVLRILLHSNFSDLLGQHDIVEALADIVTNVICIDHWLCREVMSHIASILSSALQYQLVVPIRDFFDVLLRCVLKVNSSHWSEEFIVIISRCCGCDNSMSDSSALRLSACRVVFAISEQNPSVFASSVVICHLVEALPLCSAHSDSTVLLVRTMISVASASPMLLADRFPSALSSVPFDVIDNLSTNAMECVVQREWFLTFYMT